MVFPLKYQVQLQGLVSPFVEIGALHTPGIDGQEWTSHVTEVWSLKTLVQPVSDSDHVSGIP